MSPALQSVIESATAEDFKRCTAIHRQFGTSYFLASRAFPARIRRDTDAVYAFVRVADELVDNPGGRTPEESARLLSGFKEEFLQGMEGVVPIRPELRAFCSTCLRLGITAEEPLIFLEAMEQDLFQTRYPTYESLQDYMRGSAVAVGYMMLVVMGAPQSEACLNAAAAMGEAMQLTNFLRDIGEDRHRGRVYIPEEDLRQFGVSESDLANGQVNENFKHLMRFEIDRARSLYVAADAELRQLPLSARRAVRLARRLYSLILRKIEDNQYDVFTKRARTTAVEKLAITATELIRR